MARSWWGWGRTEDAVVGTEREALTRRVAALLPEADLAIHAPPALSDLDIPAPVVRPPSTLEHLLSDDDGGRVARSRGKAFRDIVRNLHGDIDHVPDLVAHPRTEDDIVDILDWCTTHDVAAIPFGGGTSVVGGVEPRIGDSYSGCVSLDLRAMDKVLEIDHTSRAARIQAGILGPALEESLRPHGLTLRHFPQSFEFSSLGGWLATRAGGHFATLHTHIDDLCESTRVVTPAGSAESLRLPGSGAGPSPDRLFLGSEGALGIITEAWMRLQDRPRWRAKASARFQDYTRAVEATRLIAQSGLYPSNCRLLDPAEALINTGVETGGGLLVVGFESGDHPVEGALARAAEIIAQHGGVLDERGAGEDDTASSAWRSSFLRMPYQRDALAAQSMIVETFETACTWDRFHALHAAVTDAATDALKSVGITGVITCRFTHVYPDGPAPYFGIYAAGRWGSTVAQWDDIKVAVSEALAAHGGTITHHHAVGRDHRPWYDRQRPDLFAEALHAVKKTFDPSGILNPGVLIDPERPA